MFDRTLVAMALSPATEALVSALPAMRELGTREIALVHVTKPMDYPVSAAISEMGDYRQRFRHLADRLEREGFGVSVHVRSGSPATEVVKVADDWSPDVILVGSRSQSRIGEAFIGSVAWELVRRARRPVLLHRIEPIRSDPEAALESRGSGLPNRVIYPTDFSDTAERALPWVRALAKLGVPSFTLLHGAGVDNLEARAEAERRFEEFGGELTRLGAREVRREIRDARASELALLHGGSDPDNMVVMGTHGRGFLPEIVLGSESRQVVRRSAARVLLIPSADVASDTTETRPVARGEEVRTTGL